MSIAISIPCLAAVLSLAASTSAFADGVKVATPRVARPGDPILVSVTRSEKAPSGTVDGGVLHFYPASRGWQAVFALPLGQRPGKLEIEVEGAAKPAVVEVREHTFPETDVIVEEELANPASGDR